MPTDAVPDNLALRVRDLSKSYRVYEKPSDRLKEMILRRPCHEVVHALHPLSFDVLRGQCVGVVGANGAGKTTLLSLLTGTLAPTTGSIEVYGRISAILGLGVGMLPTHSGRENIRHGLITRGIPVERHEALEHEIIAFSELGSAIDKPVQTYSSGMAMRLNFSIAHAVEPDILIVDEALAVGDARFVFKCQKKMREFLDRGKTLFFVSHNTYSVRQLCTSALLLDKGRLLQQGEVNDVLRRYQMLYFGLQPDAVPPPSAATPPAASTPPAPAESAAANQVGNPEVKLLDAGLVDANLTGRQVWELAQGEALRLKARIYTPVRIARPAIGVVVKTGYGDRITGCSTVNASIDPAAIEPGEFDLTFQMPAFLQPGAYVLEIKVVDLINDPPTLLGTWEDAAQVIVRWGNYPLSGVVDAGGELHVGGQVFSSRHEQQRRLERQGMAPAAAPSSGALPRPLLAFVHVPKTAGQTINNILFSSFPKQVLNIDWNTTPGTTGNVTYFERQIERFPDAKAFTSHALRCAYPPVLAGRRMLYFTLLRDPVAATGSYIRYIKHKYRAFPPEYLKVLPPDADRMSLVQIAAWLINASEEEYLSRFWYLPCPFLGLTTEAQTVIERLERFMLVGIQERMENTLTLLRQRAAEAGLELKPIATPRINQTPTEGEEAQALADFQPLWEFVRTRASADIEVYQWALQRFEKLAARALPVAVPAAPAASAATAAGRMAGQR